MKVNRRWWFRKVGTKIRFKLFQAFFVPKFSHTQAEEQEVEFEYGKSCEFPVTADNSSVQGQFDKISPVLIQSGTQIRDCR